VLLFKYQVKEKDMEKQCSVMVAPNDKWGAFHQSQCLKKAVIERGGKYYCKIHDPEYIKMKDAERQAKRDKNNCKTPNCWYTFRTSGYDGLYRYCPFCGAKRVKC